MATRRVVIGLPLAAAMTAAAGRAGLAAAPVLDLARLRDRDDSGYAPGLAALAGRRVVVSGHVVPHARGDAGFHILAATPMGLCPHCFPEVPLPSDALLAYPRTGTRLPLDRVARIDGVLDLGARLDPASGLMTTVRLVDGIPG